MAADPTQDTNARRSERIKEELGLLRVVVGIALIAEFSLLGWFGQNVRTLDGMTLAFWVVGFLLLSVALHYIGRRAIGLLRQLETP